MTGLVEYGTRGLFSGDANRRDDLKAARAEADRYRGGMEVVARVDGGQWEPARRPPGTR